MPEFTGISEGDRRLVFKRDFTEACFLVKLQERTGGAKSKMKEARKGSENPSKEIGKKTEAIKHILPHENGIFIATRRVSKRKFSWTKHQSTNAFASSLLYGSIKCKKDMGHTWMKARQPRATRSRAILFLFFVAVIVVLILVQHWDSVPVHFPPTSHLSPSDFLVPSKVSDFVLDDLPWSRFRAVTVLHKPCSTLGYTLSNFAGNLGPEWSLLILHNAFLTSSIKSNKIVQMLKRGGGTHQEQEDPQLRPQQKLPRLFLNPQRQRRQKMRQRLQLKQRYQQQQQQQQEAQRRQQRLYTTSLEANGFPRLSSANSSSYSKLLASRRFWTSMRAQHVLIFQMDSVLCSMSPWRAEDFLQYDFVGAPWIDRWYGMDIGNGGLSLRKVSTMIKITETFKFNETENEDIFFARGIYKLREADQSSVQIPPVHVAVKFSYEAGELPRLASFGVHKTPFLSVDELSIIKTCPEAMLGVWKSCRVPELSREQTYGPMADFSESGSESGSDRFLAANFLLDAQSSEGIMLYKSLPETSEKTITQRPL